LIASQKQWLSVRNKCTDDKCLIDSYSNRIAALAGNWSESTSDNSCYDLWYQRNLISAQQGYCFESNLGKEVFKGFECSTHSPKFSSDEKKIIEQIKAKEHQLNCNINTTLTKANDSSVSSTSAEVTKIKCSDVTYGTDSYFDKMEELSKKAGLSPDGNFSRYHEDVVKALCSGDMQDVTNSIDGGFVEAKDVNAISKILGISYTVKARSESGKSYGYSKEKFISMGLCSSCADNIAQFYTEKPSSPCGILAKQALEGNPDAVSKLQESPDYCNWEYQEVASPVQETIQPPQPEVQPVTTAPQVVQPSPTINYGNLTDQQKREIAETVDYGSLTEPWVGLNKRHESPIGFLQNPF